jgi:hypothetical protein
MVYDVVALVCVSQRYSSQLLIDIHEYKFGTWFDDEPKPDEINLYARLSYLEKLQSDGSMQRSPLQGEEWVIEATVTSVMPRAPGDSTNYLPAHKEAILRKYAGEQEPCS